VLDQLEQLVILQEAFVVHLVLELSHVVRLRRQFGAVRVELG
jgi:hypothetical protein